MPTPFYVTSPAPPAHVPTSYICTSATVEAGGNLDGVDKASSSISSSSKQQLDKEVLPSIHFSSIALNLSSILASINQSFLKNTSLPSPHNISTHVPKNKEEPLVVRTQTILPPRRTPSRASFFEFWSWKLSTRKNDTQRRKLEEKAVDIIAANSPGLRRRAVKKKSKSNANTTHTNKNIERKRIIQHRIGDRSQLLGDSPGEPDRQFSSISHFAELWIGIVTSSSYTPGCRD
ncbi:hypothetical protein VTL71DRAFT_532 [Oculimacula yallundae]|uniref:Uncharacterized protein n=1 Tax=Oculimacula yallundae TaxID=86028 RepID=A0ABR4D2M7_9HELO